jgi:hypothetical protein
MKTYTITYSGRMLKESAEFPAPDRLPREGDVYEFTCRVATLANVTYNKSDLLTIIRRTKAAPHCRISSLGNLLVACKYMTSIWTNIEMMVANGELRLKESKVGNGKLYW